jgi:hypothetical protein
MKDVFDTFCKTDPITFYKTATQEITMLDPNYNADYGSDYGQYTTTVSRETVSQSFQARIWYVNHQPIRRSLEGDENLSAKLYHSWGRVKIQVEQDAYDFIKDATRMVILGQDYKFDEDVRRLGPLDDFQYYEFLLERVS